MIDLDVLIHPFRENGVCVEPFADVLVLMDGDTTPLVNDRTLQRHFGEFLDIFASSGTNGWNYPDWTMDDDGGRGWFPESHPEIDGDLVRVYPGAST